MVKGQRRRQTGEDERRSSDWKQTTRRQRASPMILEVYGNSYTSRNFLGSVGRHPDFSKKAQCRSHEEPRTRNFRRTEWKEEGE